MDSDENSSTDYSIFIGYGTKAKRVKDRWEATKRLLRFENNFVALKWLLDSFVDEYLRSKQMEDTVTVTAETYRKRRREEDAAFQGRRMATRSPPKTRFEEVAHEREESKRTIDKSTPATAVETQLQSSLKEHRPRPLSEGGRVAVSGDKGYVHLPGQYSYKYLPEYWSQYYHWAGGVPINPRLVGVGSMPGYSGYITKTPSCSSLPTRDVQREGELLKRRGSASAGKDRETSNQDKKGKWPAVNLGFKTKSMPNLQFIPKEEAASEDEEDEESDAESQGDLVALSSSSLSMPNLHKIPGERTPLLSPPSGGRFDPLYQERHDFGPSPSFSMPNLQAIPGVEIDQRKKTIREFVINRLTKNEGEKGNVKTKIFNPNGYFMSPRNHDSEKRLVKQDIRRRLLQRIEAKRQTMETHTEVLPRRKNEKLTPHVKSASKLPKVSENRTWTNKVIADEKARFPVGALGKDDRVNNNWKVPVSSISPFDQSHSARGITWDDTRAKKDQGNSGIWNPADVHVKKETISDETRNGIETVETNGNLSRPVSTEADSAKGDEDEKMDSGPEEKDNEESSDDEGENVDVESYKENDAATDDSGCSESELADDTW